MNRTDRVATRTDRRRSSRFHCGLFPGFRRPTAPQPGEPSPPRPAWCKIGGGSLLGPRPRQPRHAARAWLRLPWRPPSTSAVGAGTYALPASTGSGDIGPPGSSGSPAASGVSSAVTSGPIFSSPAGEVPAAPPRDAGRGSGRLVRRRDSRLIHRLRCPLLTHRAEAVVRKLGGGVAHLPGRGGGFGKGALASSAGLSDLRRRVGVLGRHRGDAHPGHVPCAAPARRAPIAASTEASTR